MDGAEIIGNGLKSQCGARDQSLEGLVRRQVAMHLYVSLTPSLVFWPHVRPSVCHTCVSRLTVARTPKSSHTTSVLESLHWLKINERIECKLLSLTYKVLTTNQPQYLHNLISVQPCYNTRSSSMVTLARPPTRSSLKITNRSFRYATPCLLNAH